MTTTSKLAAQLGFARTHAEGFNQKAPDWRANRGFVLESSVYEYVRENSPLSVSSDEIRTITALTLDELMKMPAPQEPEPPKNPDLIHRGRDPRKDGWLD